MTAITRRYSTRGKITFDDYIACCVKLRALTGMLGYSLITIIAEIYFCLIKSDYSLISSSALTFMYHKVGFFQYSLQAELEQS